MPIEMTFITNPIIEETSPGKTDIFVQMNYKINPQLYLIHVITIMKTELNVK